MTVTTIIHELEQLPIAERLLVIESALKSIRIEPQKKLRDAVDSLYDDYKTNKDLLAFTKLDKEPFYEAR